MVAKTFRTGALFLLLVIGLLALTSPSATANERLTEEQIAEILPEQRVLPGDPTYDIKLLFENVRTAFIRAPEARTERQLLLAERRLAETRALTEREEISAAERARRSAIAKDQYDRQVSRALADNLERERDDLVALVEERTQRQEAALRAARTNVPVDRRQGVDRAITNAQVRSERTTQIKSRIDNQERLSQQEILFERSLPVEILPAIPQNTPSTINIEIPADQAEREAVVRQIRNEQLRAQVASQLNVRTQNEPTRQGGREVFSVTFGG